jgi:hypothetical protein
MSMTADELASILASLGDIPDPQPGDARRAPRVPMEGMVQFTVSSADVSNGTPHPPASPVRQRANLTNLSARGLCIEHTEPMHPGQQFVLHLPQGSRKAANVLCTVLHCEPAGAGRYTIGAEFTCSVAASLGLPLNSTQLERIRHSILD